MAFDIERVNQDAVKPAKAGRGDTEIDAMNRTAPLLELIQEDTGESPSGQGELRFHHCPVCGHKDDFTYYSATNSWKCFSSSNATGHEGGCYTEYLLATNRAANYSEAVTKLREATGNPRKKRSMKVYDSDEPFTCGPAPTQGSSTTVTATNEHGSTGFKLEIVKPIPRSEIVFEPELIHGLLDETCKMLVTGASKAGKTQLCLGLAVAIASGDKWLGRKCKQGQVLYVDFEMRRSKMNQRLNEICDVLGIPFEQAYDNIDFVHLRDIPVTVEDTVEALRTQVPKGKYKMVILDPVYLMLGGQENDADAVTAFFQKMGEIALALEVAICVSHHHSKGGKGDRAAIDRSSGSGIFGRYPDTIVDLIELHGPDGEEGLDENPVFEVSTAGARDYKEHKGKHTHVVLSWPVFIEDEAGLTAEWKPATSQGKGGKATASAKKEKARADLHQYEAAILAEFIKTGAEEMTLKDAATACGGIKTNTLANKLRDNGSELVDYISNGRGKAATIKLKFAAAPVQTAISE